MSIEIIPEKCVFKNFLKFSCFPSFIKGNVLTKYKENETSRIYFIDGVWYPLNSRFDLKKNNYSSYLSFTFSFPPNHY